MFHLSKEVVCEKKAAYYQYVSTCIKIWSEISLCHPHVKSFVLQPVTGAFKKQNLKRVKSSKLSLITCFPSHNTASVVTDSVVWDFWLNLPIRVRVYFFVIQCQSWGLRHQKEGCCVCSICPPWKARSVALVWQLRLPVKYHIGRQWALRSQNPCGFWNMWLIEFTDLGPVWKAGEVTRDLCSPQVKSGKHSDFK